MQEIVGRLVNLQLQHAIKISAPELEQVLAGTTIRQSRNKQELDHARSQAKLEAKIAVELAEEALSSKQIHLGSLKR